MDVKKLAKGLYKKVRTVLTEPFTPESYPRRKHVTLGELKGLLKNSSSSAISYHYLIKAALWAESPYALKVIFTIDGKEYVFIDTPRGGKFRKLGIPYGFSMIESHIDEFIRKESGRGDIIIFHPQY